MLQRPFDLAAQLGLIPFESLFKGLTFAEGQQGHNWTEDEYRVMLRYAKGHFRRMLVMIRFSGMQPGEVAALEWKHVRVEAKAIVLPEHKTAWKTGKPRVIPLNHVMVKLLSYQKRHNPLNCRRIFCNSHFTPWTTKASRRRRCRRSGCRRICLTT